MPQGLRFVCPSDATLTFSGKARDWPTTAHQTIRKRALSRILRPPRDHESSKDAARALALVGRKELQQRHGQGTNFVPSRCCVCFSAKLVSLCCFDSPHAFREDSTKYAPTPKNLIVEKIAKAAE